MEEGCIWIDVSAVCFFESRLLAAIQEAERERGGGGSGGSYLLGSQVSALSHHNLPVALPDSRKWRRVLLTTSRVLCLQKAAGCRLLRKHCRAVHLAAAHKPHYGADLSATREASHTSLLGFLKKGKKVEIQTVSHHPSRLCLYEHV